MIVACSRMHKRACLLGGGGGGSGGMPPPPPPPPGKILNLDPIRLLLTKSGARLLFNTRDKTVLTYSISRNGGGELWLGGENSRIPLCMKPW